MDNVVGGIVCSCTISECYKVIEYISLKKKEILYFVLDSQWYQLTTNFNQNTLQSSIVIYNMNICMIRIGIWRIQSFLWRSKYSYIALKKTNRIFWFAHEIQSMLNLCGLCTCWWTWCSRITSVTFITFQSSVLNEEITLIESANWYIYTIL
jgi:hypothetical protein